MENNLVKPMGDRVLVKPLIEGDTKTKSGIILSDSTSRGEAVWGEVISVGTGIFTQSGDRLPMTVSVGDLVMYKKDFGGVDVKLDDVKYLLFNEHELLMISPK
jgi:chaperonin GroES